ncbi:MAG TPA: hypothetical protein VH143_13770 [Kofleriaceae bacterium]|nr:hypothetical protein [Kofleriaceae bacterium]
MKRFGFASDDHGNRLLFPHASIRELGGQSGKTSYGAAECAFDNLEGRLGALRWSADAGSIGSAWLRDGDGRFSIVAERIELPHGLLMVRGASSRLEIVSPHLSLSETRITIKGPFKSSSPSTPAAPKSPTQRQERLRFLDSLSGRIYATLKVQLDLPVLGVRTLDQELRVPIQEGSLDFRALEEGLDWLEGAFLDIDADQDRLAVRWKVPIFGSSHDLITFQLDKNASALAAFGRVPVRSLADFALASRDDKDKKDDDDDKKRKILRSFSIEGVDVAVSLLAPRNVDVGGGMIAFGGDDQPGMVDLKVKGVLHDQGKGAIEGAIGSIDTTIKDVRLGPITMTADRLHFDGIDQLEVEFDGFSPTSITVVVHRVTATNLSIQIGR